MDEIEQRLRTATDTCISSYDSWRKNQKETNARETLMEAVHELRKVAARLEIEIAVSERDEMAAKPIPIPPHRSARKPFGDTPDDNIGNAAADNIGNGGGNSGGGGFRDHRTGGGGGGGGAGGNPRRRRMGVGGPHGGGGGGNGNGPQGGGGGDQG